MLAFRLGEEYPRRRGGISLQLRKGKRMDKKITRSLFIEGREWFDKTGGNSYFSARIWVDGEVVGVLPFQYGYGNVYEYEAQKWLLSEGYLPQEGKNYHSLFTVSRELGFDYYAVKSYHKKSEMFKAHTYHKVGA